MQAFENVDVAQLRAGTGLKWHAFDEDVLPLWVAEMDIPPAAVVREAVCDAMAMGNTGYPHGDACARAYASFAADRWGWDDLPTDKTVAVADVMTGIREVVDLLTEPGDPVVITPPVYGPFHDMVDLAGRSRIDAPLGPELRLDIDAIDAALADAAARTSTTPVLVLCSPHNPGGVVHTAKELAAVAQVARAHTARVVVDEIHAPLVHPDVAFTPWLSVPDTAEDFAVVSASKGWNLAALKAALVVPGPAAGELAHLNELVRHGPSLMGLLAHTVALTSARDWLDKVVSGVADNHRRLRQLAAEHLPGTRLVEARASYLAWMDVSALGLGDSPAAVLRERARVALSDGLSFGAGGADHVRFNVATSPALLTEAVKRIAAVVD